MWIVIKILGAEVLAVGIGLVADDDTATHYIDNSGGQFELVPEEVEYEEEEEYDPEYDNRVRPPFGFLHA
jgi:hypothetical protein